MTEKLNFDPSHFLTRRHFFQECGVGLGKIALASLLAGGGRALALDGGSRGNVNLLAPRPPHHRSKVKSVIYLFMAARRASSTSSMRSRF